MARRSGNGGAQVFRITGARQGLAEDVRGRQRRYVISMGLRTVAVILAASLWNVERYVAIVALVLGAVLPYVAVVIANAGRENAPGLPSTFVRMPSAPMIPPPPPTGRPVTTARSPRPERPRARAETRTSGPDHGVSAQPEFRPVREPKNPRINRAVPVPGDGLPVTYFVRAPHPPSERQTDAGQLPRGCSASPCDRPVLSRCDGPR